MDPEMDLVSKLMGNDPGGRNFFASCLLLLNPEQLKACRLVNSVWDKFIMEEVWGKKRVRRRKRLEVKLVERWKTAEPITVEIGQARERVWSIFCNDAYVFCGGSMNGRVKVYSLTSGEWVRDLLPGEVGTGCSVTRVSGSKEVIAAVMWNSRVTVWSSHREMEQLYYFDAINHNCLDLDCLHGGDKDIEDFKVAGSKTALLLADPHQMDKTSLVVIKRGEHMWEEKTLVCLPSDSRLSSLAIDGDWVAVVKRFGTGQKVMLWQDDIFRQEVDLPGCLPVAVMAIAMELPFFSLRDIVKGCAFIKVFRLAADSGMEDISTVASLFKTIPIDDNLMPIRGGIICNQLFFGFVLASSYDEEGPSVILIEKKALLDPAAGPPLQTARRQINLEVNGSIRNVDMNTTCLVFGQDQRQGSEEVGSLLLRNDFWMPN